MITVRYLNDPSQECMIRPTPFVSISMAPQRNKECMIGVTYTITLTGTILSDEGMPYALKPEDWQQLIPEYPETGAIGTRTGAFSAFDKTGISARPRPPKQKVTKHAHAILSKQRTLRSLFARDGQIVQISDIADENVPVMWFFSRFVSCSFEEGLYVNTSNYTIVLETDTILQGNPSDTPIAEAGGFFDFCFNGNEEEDPTNDLVDNFSESWQIEPEENPENLTALQTYRLTHNLSATGKITYLVDGSIQYRAWENAKRWVVDKLSNTGLEAFGYPNQTRLQGGLAIAADNINLDRTSYSRGYNHSANESIDKTGGTFSVTESWILARSPVLESFSCSTDISAQSALATVTINGTITGLSSYLPEEYQNSVIPNDKFNNATVLWDNLSTSVVANDLGRNSPIYQRAEAIATARGITDLNFIPISSNVSYDEFGGVITYNVTYDNRPLNLITGSLTESVQVNDTYPGDIFATIPVLGRTTGPVLQYIGGRTEYKRDVSINLTMDRNNLAGAGQGPVNRNTLLLNKPSIQQPQAQELSDLLKELTPAREPGIRKWFQSPPQESWNPQQGTYSLNISFVYELDV